MPKSRSARGIRRRSALLSAWLTGRAASSDAYWALWLSRQTPAHRSRSLLWPASSWVGQKKPHRPKLSHLRQCGCLVRADPFVPNPLLPRLTGRTDEDPYLCVPGFHQVCPSRMNLRISQTELPRRAPHLASICDAACPTSSSLPGGCHAQRLEGYVSVYHLLHTIYRMSR